MDIVIPGDSLQLKKLCRRAFYSHGVIHHMCILYRLVAARMRGGTLGTLSSRKICNCVVL